MAKRKISRSVEEKPPIYNLVVNGLQGSAYEAVAEDLANEFVKRNLSPDTLHNAPLKVKNTYGADIYQVLALLQTDGGN